MSKLAGMFYFDLRPTGVSDEQKISSALEHIGSFPPVLYRRPGLIMGSAPSNADPSPESRAYTGPEGLHCTWDGRLDNAPALRSQFDLPSDTPDAAFALEAYRCHSSPGLLDIIGDWSLALWDPQTRSVILASDYAGTRPLYYHHGADRLLWSSSLSDLVRWTGINEIDEEYVAVFLTQGHAPGRTPYRGIHPVPPGHAVACPGGSDETRAFWELPTHRKVRYPDERDYEEHLRLLFRESIAARCRTSSPVCAELSGGLDSSSIVCMADRLKAENAAGFPDLFTFSYICENSTDGKYREAVEQACAARPIHFPLEQFPFVAANQVGGAAPAWWEPRFCGIASQMASLGSSVLLTGQLGDLIMGNILDDSGQVADYLQEYQFMQAAREAFAWSQSLRVPIYSILWRALRANCTAWAAPSIADSMCDRYGAIDSLLPAFRKRVALSVHDRHRDGGWQSAPPGRRRLFRSLSEMLSARVLQVPQPLEHISYAHPYAHRPLVEFMLTVPSRVVCRPGEPRRLMRRAFGDLLPPAVLKRKSKTAYGRTYREAILPLAIEILRCPDAIRLVEFRYVDFASFTDRLQRFTDGLDCNESQLRQLILLEYWLRRVGHDGASMQDESALTWIN
jgi:asparagine synthase (glutamine-hydrolysing)